ncbi:MAG: hypothetical protein DMG13_33320, partial [Acidobacteria bacterium]
GNLTRQAGEDVGSYAIQQGTLALNSNYNLTFIGSNLTITPRTLTVTADNKVKTYGDPNPALTASYSGFVNGDTDTVLSGAPALSTAATATSGVGSYPITVGAGTLSAANYSFAFVNGALTINKAMLTVTADDKSKVYGSANPTFTASYTGFVNGQTLATSGVTGTPALTTTVTASSPAGTYAITAAAGGLVSPNYSFAVVNGTLTVNKAVLTVTAANTSRIYGAANPTFTASYSGFVNGQSLATSGVTGTPALTTTANASSPVGTYPITAALGTLSSANYSFTFVNGTLTINKATLTITANNVSKTYGNTYTFSTACASVDCSVTGLGGGDTIASVTLTSTGAPAGALVGSYPIITGTGFTFGSGSLSNYNVVYVNGVLDTVLSGAPALSTAATATSGVGSYPITVGAGTLSAANYSFAFVNGALTINKAMLTVTADDKSKDYGSANPTFTASYTGFVNGQTLATSGVTGTPALTTTVTASSPAGTYAITAAAGGLVSPNYSFAVVNGTLTVNKAVLTVTAANTSRIYGAANPTFTASYSGFVNGQSLATSGVTGTPALTTTAQVTLSASVQDPSVGGGTVSAATVTFTDLLTGKVLASGVKVSPVANTSSHTGTANTIVTLSTGQYGAQEYLIEVTLNGSYKNEQQTTACGPTLLPCDSPAYQAAHPVVTVMIPATKYTMQGSGALTPLSEAAGVYGLGTASYTAGFNYTSKGTNTQGKMELIIVQTDGTYYQ